MAVLRITEYPNSMDRYYRQLPNTNERKSFSIYRSAGRGKKQQNKKVNYVTLDGKGKYEGRKAKKEQQPELVALVKELRRKNWKTKKQMSLRQISLHLFELGYVNERGKPYNTQSVKDMVHCFDVAS